MKADRNRYPFHGNPRMVSAPMPTARIHRPSTRGAVYVMGARAGYWASLIVAAIAWCAA